MKKEGKLIENNKLINSKLRVQKFGEVFTSEKEVNNMLNMFDHELQRPESRFLESACGEGNFLVAILKKKLSKIFSIYKKNQLDCEKYSILAVSSLYGIDIIKDNVDKTIKNLETLVLTEFSKIFKVIKNDFKKTINYILNKNIIYGDSLTLTIKDKKKPIVFSEWSFMSPTLIKRRDFTFKHLIDSRPFDGFNLFSDLGEKAFIPEPEKEFDGKFFLKLYELE
jgi:hypothetical protein